MQSIKCPQIKLERNILDVIIHNKFHKNPFITFSVILIPILVRVISDVCAHMYAVCRRPPESNFKGDILEMIIHSKFNP